MKQIIFLLLFALATLAKGQDVVLPPYEVIEVPTLYGSQLVDWGNVYLHASDFYIKTRGEGSVIFILDTGIDTEHPDLKANILLPYCKDFTGSALGFTDGHGHGSHCAGIAAAINNEVGVVGVAPKAKLVAVKVLDDSGSGSYAWISQGIRYVADLPNDANLKDKKRIISMSLGGNEGSTELLSAIKYAISKGVFIVAAAGNSGCSSDETVGFPGNYPEIITVASLGKTELPSYFSSCGKNVDVIAPGENIYSTHKNGGYVYLSGTSMATPQIAGVAALLCDYYDIKSQGVLEAYLRKYAKDLAPAGFDTRNGYGAPILTRYNTPPDGIEPPIDTTPTPPTPPVTFKSRVLSIPVKGEYSILYGKASGGKFRFAKVAGIVIEYTTKESVEVATDRINAAVQGFYTNRGFVLPDDQYDTDFAAGWAEYFLKMILRQQGFNVQTKYAWVSEVLPNNTVSLIYYDKQFPVSTSSLKAKRLGRQAQLKTFTFD